MKRLVKVAVVAMVLCGCSNDQKPIDASKTNLTRRQQDSMLAASKVPGAKAVGKATTVADSTSAKASDFDKLQDTIH